jgi:hypothetical protein
MSPAHSPLEVIGYLSALARKNHGSADRLREKLEVQVADLARGSCPRGTRAAEADVQATRDELGKELRSAALFESARELVEVAAARGPVVATEARVLALEGQVDDLVLALRLSLGCGHRKEGQLCPGCRERAERTLKAAEGGR